jgi:hypothetical protein
MTQQPGGVIFGKVFGEEFANVIEHYSILSLPRSRSYRLDQKDNIPHSAGVDLE